MRAAQRLQITALGDQEKRKVRYPALLSWDILDIRNFISEKTRVGHLDFMKPCLEFHRDGKRVSLSLHEELRLCPGDDIEVYSHEINDDWWELCLKELDEARIKFPER